MAKDGWPFVLGALGAAIIGGALGYWVASPWYILAGLGILSAIFFSYFFRDPARTAPSVDGAIIAPADGRILGVFTRPDGAVQIDTFLSVWDVHVNRAPISGRVVSSEHQPGRFFAAMRPEAGVHNERQNIVLDSPLGQVRFAQIAGVLARRIICRVKAGDEVQTGERVGLIRFGSRAEVILPPGFDATVTEGDRVRAGETIIACRSTGPRDQGHQAQ